MEYVKSIIVLLVIAAITMSSAVYAETTYSIRYHVVVNGEVSPLLNISTRIRWDYYLSLNMTFHGENMTICYNVEGALIPKQIMARSACSVVNMTELIHLSREAGGANNILPTVPLGKNVMIHEYKFLGTGDYKGLPVYKLQAKISPAFYSGGTNASMINVYLYAGLPVPLYASASIDILGNLSVLVDAVEANLPRNVPTAYMSTYYYDILAGGLPGAHITVEGEKGSYTLKATNNGDAVGYIIVIYRNTGKAWAAIIPPGQIVVVKIPVALLQQVNLETRENQQSATYQYIVAGTAAAIAAVVLIYILRWRKHS